MQFKHPEILYFLFLLVIPILVHLFQLRRFKKEYFTNVNFLKELSIQTRKSSKIKKWLLLATRMLILTAIVFAFAQPFFAAKDSNNVTNELFIVLDNSYSMQAKGQKGELLKRAVEDLLQHVPENQTFTLLTNSESYWNTDIKSVQRELQQSNYSAAPFEMGAMMAKVSSRKSPFKKDVIIITDGIGTDQNDLKSIQSENNTLFIIQEAEQKNNISIDSAFLSQALDNFYEVGIVLSVFGDAPPEIPVALYNNDKLIAKTSAKLAGKQQQLKFMIPKEDFHGYASLTDGGLEYDNKLFFSIEKPEKTNVISIGDAGASNFLSKIYTAAEFNYNNYELAALDYNSIEKQDAIVLNQLKEIPQALQTTLKSFVERGGNVIVIPSAESSIQNLNTFAANFGNVRYQNLVAGQKLISNISFGHPLFSGVFERKITNFQYPNVKSSFSLANAPSILGYDDRTAFLTSIRTASSSVYLFAAPIDKNHSNFQNSPLIVPTFYNMAQNAAKTGVTAITIGQRQPILVDAMLTKDEIVNVQNSDKESSEKFIPIQQVLNNKVKLDFNDLPNNAGNFGVFKGDEKVKNISFNFSRTESNLAAGSNIEESVDKIDSIEAVFDKLQSDRTDNEIWKLFILLGLLFLIAELLIQKFVR